MEDYEIYHYKDGNGKWVPFTITKEMGKKWNDLCKVLMMQNAQPTYIEYHEFMENN